MPTYMYQAQTRDGKLINSKIESPNLNMAIDTLTASRLKILDISPEKFDPLSIFGALHVLKKESVVTLTRRMTTMIKSGLAIDRSLSVMQEQEEDPKLKAILAQVLHDVRVGGSLSWSMAKHPVAFDGLYVSMIKVGEATGDLGELMDRLADFLERDLAVRQKANASNAGHFLPDDRRHGSPSAHPYNVFYYGSDQEPVPVLRHSPGFCLVFLLCARISGFPQR